MKSKFFALCAILLLALSSCKDNSEKNDSEVKEKSPALMLAKKIKVNSIQEIIDYISKYEAKYSGKKVPVLYFSGSFAIHSSDWDALSDQLEKAENKIRVKFDFSKCYVEEVSESGKESNTPFYALSSSLFSCADSLLEIHFPEGLTEINAYSFSSCENLRAIFFPQNTVVHFIGYHAFCNLPSLEEIHLYHYDGSLHESFTDCGVKPKGSDDYDVKGKLKEVEMPANPVYIEDYGMGYYQYAFGKTEVGKVITPEKIYDFDEWVEWGQSFKPVTGEILEISSSSELDEKSGKYSAGNVASASWHSWVEGSSGDGSGEYLTFTLKNPTSIDYICIKNGFGNLEYYWSNNRPKDITLIFDEDEKNVVKDTLNDTPFAQYININRFDKLYSKITLKIESVYKGTDNADDCAIDEIAVNAGIERRQAYNAFYTSGEIPYVYSPENQRMLKDLYSDDVGENNVRISKDGFVEVNATDWEYGTRSWTRPSGAFSGTLYNGFFPGTGGGHSYDKFHIYLNPNGNHYLFTWHEESSGVFEVYPANLKIYSWKNKNWCLQTADNHDSAFNEIFSLLSLIKKRNLTFKVDISEYDHNSDVEIIVHPEGGSICLPVTFSFSYDEKNGLFLPYKKDVITELSFGTVESLKALGEWENKYEEDDKSSRDYGNPIQIFTYPACYNQNPEIVRFLSQNGYKVENEYQNSREDTKKYKFTALEAWQFGKNNAEVRKALIDAGASYSGEMLVKAFKNENLAELKELLPLVNPDNRKVVLAEIAYYYEYKGKNIPYIRKVLSLLKENGVSLDSKFCNDERKGETCTLMIDAFNQNADVPLLQLYLDFGLKIPKLIQYGYSMTTPVALVADWYRDSVYLEEYEEDFDSEYKEKQDKNLKKARDIFSLLIKNNVNLNLQDEMGDTAIHDFCGQSSNYRELETIRYLIKLGCDVNITNQYGLTPLSSIVKECRDKTILRKIAQLLIDAGAKIDIEAKDKNTALSYFIDDNFYYVEEDNEDENDDFDIQDNLDVEQTKENLDIVEFLLSNNANANCHIEYSYGRRISALQYAAIHGQKELCVLLMKYGAELDGTTSDYAFTPVLFATKCFCNPFSHTSKKALFETIKFLVESGADCSIITKNTETNMWDDTGDDVSLILLLKPGLSCHDSPLGKALMELFLNHGASTEKLTEDMLKNAGFSKDEIKKIVDARK